MNRSRPRGRPYVRQLAEDLWQVRDLMQGRCAARTSQAEEREQHQAAARCQLNYPARAAAQRYCIGYNVRKRAQACDRGCPAPDLWGRRSGFGCDRLWKMDRPRRNHWCWSARRPAKPHARQPRRLPPSSLLVRGSSASYALFPSHLSA